MAVSLGAHELTTNAIKYGALSNDAGRVSIEWAVSETDNIRELVVNWVERGGPSVAEPARRGFGSRLLERMTASEGGTVSRAFEPEGLTCTLRFRL
jgi:two-component sensor histidine kinase